MKHSKEFICDYCHKPIGDHTERDGCYWISDGALYKKEWWGLRKVCSALFLEHEEEKKEKS